MVSSAEPMGPLFGFPPTYWVTAFLLSWTETDGVLTSVRAGMDTILTGVIIALTSAEVNTDDPLGGCGNDCQLTGYWVIAPEPGSSVLFASAFGVWGVIGRRRVCSLWQAKAKARNASDWRADRLRPAIKSAWIERNPARQGQTPTRTNKNR